LEGLFGKHDEMRGKIMEVELLTLDPKIFDNIQYFFTKFKDLLSQLKAYGVDKSKEEKQMVLTILSKLGPEFSCFYQHSILSDSPLEPPRRFLLLRNLSNP
jgi:hypothetical protein